MILTTSAVYITIHEQDWAQHGPLRNANAILYNGRHRALAAVTNVLSTLG